MPTKSYRIIGTPFSTFTRTITLGLHYKNIPFEQITTLPQSDIARQAHPYAYLPTLIIEDSNGQSTKLSETQAILRYVDRIAPEPTLHFHPLSDDGILEEKMWEVVSLIASFGFPIIEVGVVKPHLKASQNGASEADILHTNKEEVSKVSEFLRIVEERSVPKAKYLFEEHPTWADFYLFPLLADLRALPEWDQVASGNARLVNWMETMDALDEVKKTSSGTLADGRP